MRLLDTVSGQFVEKDPCDRKTQYAILSHAWDSKGEQIYQALRDIQERYDSNRRLQRGHSIDPQPENQSGRAQCHQDGPFDATSFPVRDRSPSDFFPSHLASHDTLPMTFIAPVSVRAPEPPSSPPLPPIWDDPELSPKIRDACAVARANGYRYIWIDSCCIDKTSSSELSEAINSMYQWYARADVCYAFLADVPARGDHQRKGSHFRRSRWFTRGWTLQELIAPAHVEFLAMDWTSIGSKRRLASLISKVTNINYSALLRLEPLSDFSVAQRLSWASKRQTTRVEDRAYSLLGLFNIHMPTLYGEGDRAFRRLQEEIMRRIPDQSLFAWSWNNAYLGLNTLRPQPSGGLSCKANNRKYGGMDASLLAPSPDVFVDCRTIRAVSHDEIIRWVQCYPDLPPADYNFTPHGIRTQLPVIPLPLYFPACAKEDAPPSRWYLLILGCEHRDLPGHLLGRVCRIPASASHVQRLYCGRATVSGSSKPSHSFELLPLSPATISQLRPPQVAVETIYIPHSDRTDVVPAPVGAALREPHETIRLVLPAKTRRALYAQGYTANLRGPAKAHPTTHWLTLARDEFPTITIEYRHTLGNGGRQLLVEAHVKASSEDLELHPRVVAWTDSSPWARALGKRVVVNTAPRTFTMILDLHLATQDHYVPSVEIYEDPSTPVTDDSARWTQSPNSSPTQPVYASPRTSKAGDEKEEDESGTTSRTDVDDGLAALDGARSWWVGGLGL